ncbi:sigma-70 family RNA polymerase sigma factor [Pseudenhygromyxa sp. WMMC2535]|nr:sigma-70 family RNA polymerase sigma factor [Pseudenhygromyxa sp. WMMC2535]
MRGGRQAADGIRELAGLLWSIDERLAAGSTAGYRTNGSYGASQLQGRGLPAPGLAKEPVVEPSAAPGAAIFVEDDELDEDRERQLAAVLREHGSSISRMAASYGRHSAEREDLEQDIALALWRALPSFRGESSLKTFVHRVARYACFRHLRRRRPGAESVDDTPLSDPDTCPEAALLHEDDRARMEQALADLPRTLESTLSLHLRGFSYAEIAEALGITERNVSVRLTRARKQLRRQLA